MLSKCNGPNLWKTWTIKLCMMYDVWLPAWNLVCSFLVYCLLKKPRNIFFLCRFELDEKGTASRRGVTPSACFRWTIVYLAGGPSVILKNIWLVYSGPRLIRPLNNWASHLIGLIFQDTALYQPMLKQNLECDNYSFILCMIRWSSYFPAPYTGKTGRKEAVAVLINIMYT